VVCGHIIRLIRVVCGHGRLIGGSGRHGHLGHRVMHAKPRGHLGRQTGPRKVQTCIAPRGSVCTQSLRKMRVYVAMHVRGCVGGEGKEGAWESRREDKA